MSQKNIVLLGGSNSVLHDGLQMGIREGIEMLNARLDSSKSFDADSNISSFSTENNNDYKNDMGDIPSSI